MKSEGITSLDWGRVKFFLGEVLRNFTRNAAMQATAIGTVTVTIVMLGIFLYTRETVIHLGNEIFNQIEISVYFNEGAANAQIHDIRTRLAADRRVISQTFVPKKQGLREMRQRMKGQIDTSILTENPLPDKLRVRVRRPDMVSAVAAHIAKFPGVATVNYGQDVVSKLVRISAVLVRLGLAIIIVFVFVAAIIISNTIRLTVFARRREIAIMQLVGATNAYIRGPFICEGMLDGLLGALLAIGALAAVRIELLPKLFSALPFIRLNTAAVDERSLILELLIVGGSVGIVASWISVGRYLRT
ncbi:MAG: permease-like cell division protein FtsX [Candidatus Eremiobacteraeota bacterium]|nr:permease-like cell division protein FtsX [Candidatus Eremiobacteraeota bacterium]